MVKRIGEREEIKMKALKQREQANRPTQREAEKYCRSLGTRQQEAGGEGRASGGSAAKTVGQASAREGGQEGREGNGWQRKPPLAGQGRGAGTRVSQLPSNQPSPPALALSPGLRLTGLQLLWVWVDLNN